MKLVLTNRKFSTEEKLSLSKQLDSFLSVVEYDGMSTSEIKTNLLLEPNKNVVVVSADSRLLKLVRSDGIFTLDDVFIYRDGKLISIQSASRKELRDAHNLMNMYEARKFETKMK